MERRNKVMGKIAVLFSGQGAQYPGMGKELYDCSPAAKAVYDMADSIREGTSNQCFNGTKEELSVTVNTQPTVFTADLAAAEAVKEKGIKIDYVAGFSLGEIAALGGFVNMLGEEERSNEEGSFSTASIPKRIAVVLAGGAVNIIFGLLVYFILVSSSGNYISNIVDSILPNYSAQEAGIEQNDKILKINGKKIRLKSDIDEALQKSNGNEVLVTVKRNDDIKEIKVIPTKEEIKKLLAEKKRMYREAVTYIDKAPKGVLKYHGFFELIIYKHTVVC